MDLFGHNNQISVPIRPDEDGFTGRECPKSNCEGYFKVEFGTGLQGDNLPCHCPYCGHTESHNAFWTKEQIEHAKSVAIRQITDAFHNEFKKMEFDHKPRGGFGIGVSMKVTQTSKHPIHYYREKKLETEVVCKHCTLRYAVYGVFAFCPDCGTHNSLQILNKNLELIQKLLTVATMQEPQIAQYLIENSLEDCISAFDGFGRETCRVFAPKAEKPEKAAEIRFQNIATARDRVKEQFGVDFSATMPPDDWKHILRAFQKRHLLAHKMGVVDEDYLSATGELPSLLGRKASIAAPEVRELVAHLQCLGSELFRGLESKT